MNECANQVGTSERKKGADHALESLHNMKEALPELWEEAVKDEDVRNSSKAGIETSVIAWSFVGHKLALLFSLEENTRWWIFVFFSTASCTKKSY